MRFVVLDTETTGLDPQKHSLLTIGLVVVDFPSGIVVDDLHIPVREDMMLLDPQAMEVNGIDLATHSENSFTVTEAVGIIANFLGKHFPGKGKIRLAGHNVDFDISFLKRLWRLASANAPEWPFDYRTLDTASLGYAEILGDPDRPNDTPSLDKMLHKYGITIEKQDRHTALGDAKATAHLIAAMLEGRCDYEHAPTSHHHCCRSARRASR